MNLQPELEETISSIIEYQQLILLKKIAKDKNWDFKKMNSEYTSQKIKSENNIKRGRGRPTKSKKTNLDTEINYSAQDGDNDRNEWRDYENDYRIVDPNLFT